MGCSQHQSGSLCRGLVGEELTFVQRRERGHGTGNSRSWFEADRKIDARSKTGTAPDDQTDMREPANKSLLTDVSGCAPTAVRPCIENFEQKSVRRTVSINSGA